MKLVIVGAGDIGKNTLAAVLRTFPKNQNLDIIFLNRSFNKAQAAFLDAEIAENEYDIFEDSQNVNSQMKVKISSDNSDLSDADMIIFTAGVTASSIGSTRREDALLFVGKMINSFANEVKRYAPNALILTITNPSDIATWMMQDATGFPPERVLGFGCELDARRFIKALKKGLEKIGIKPKQINTDVIGGHSEKNMIIPEQSIRIDGMLLSDFKAKHSQQCEEIDLAIKNADQVMEGEVNHPILPHRHCERSVANQINQPLRSNSIGL